MIQLSRLTEKPGCQRRPAMEYRILIVEDEEGIAQAVCAAMARWGLKAEAVTDFRHVMEDFARVQPHLVLLDISLPFMNGYHWCT